MNELVGQFATFRIVDMTAIGAFLDWGDPKDLFLPQSEQIQNLNIGDEVVVYIFLDKQERPCATMRLERYASPDVPTYKVEQKVKILI